MTKCKETKQSIAFKESLDDKVFTTPVSIEGTLDVSMSATIGGVLKLTSDANNLTATGTTEADALTLSGLKTVHIITAGGADTGVKLPIAFASGRVLFIKNFTGTAKKLYVTGTDIINEITDGSGLTIAANSGVIVIDALANAWVSF